MPGSSLESGFSEGTVRQCVKGSWSEERDGIAEIGESFTRIARRLLCRCPLAPQWGARLLQAAREHQAINVAESHSLGRSAMQHIELVSKEQDFSMQRSPRPE